MRFLLPALVVAFVSAACGADVPLVADGSARAVVVLSDSATPVARYAAEEFVYHVQKATGVRLAIVGEKELPSQPAGRVFIGDGEHARKAGIDAGKLPPETFVLRTPDNALFIVGGDGEGDPLDVNTPAGTLFGVYEALERALQVRWLWPGELGEFVPKRATVAMPEMNVTVPPRFLQRNLRSTLRVRGPAEFSPEALKKVRHDQDVWLRRHRIGKAVRLRYGHAFTNWWDRFGKDHPEWFNLLESGVRKPPGTHVSMCVSDPEFHRLIIHFWKENRAKNPGEFVNINGCENDINGLCTCARCRAWDGPDVTPISARYAQRCVSDRYARFWLTLQQLGAREDPNATVVGYAYVNYAPPPATDIRLNEHIFVGTVPDLFFPRSAEEQEWVIAQWLGWRKTGCRLFLRPNYMLEGYCMPHLFVRQFAEEFLFEARNGMVGTDFDSLTAMWATQGPNLYLLGRMHVRPDLDADTLLAEYYAGFGTAAEHVRAYFEYWEKHMLDNRERHDEVAKRRRAGWSSYAAKAHELFPPESFKPAWELLERAQKAAAADPACRARVEFLRKGLTHAQLCAKTAAVIAGQEGGRPSPAACHRALAELRAFRKTIEMDNVANLNFCAFVEQRAWKAPEGYTGEPLKPLVETPAEFATRPVMPTRGLHTCVVLLKAGERLRAHLACKRIGDYTAHCDWSVFSPTDERLAQGTIEVGQEAIVDLAAPSAGVYSLVLNSGANVAAVTLLNAHAALTGRRIHLLGQSSPLCFFVPAGTKKFSITLETQGPGETATITVVAPDGQPVGSVTTGTESKRVLEAAVAPDHSGKTWKLSIAKGGGGVLEDVMLTLDPSLPPYWSPAADRLLVPAR